VGGRAAHSRPRNAGGRIKRRKESVGEIERHVQQLAIVAFDSELGSDRRCRREEVGGQEATENAYDDFKHLD
jgi:hypothetical protein